ncbi:MAG: peptidylprolyl isomerase [Parvibaculales bacterium]
MKYIHHIFIVLIFAFMPFLPAQAQDRQGIAVIVNDDIISLFDVKQRVSLFLASSSIPRTEENINAVRAQILRTLINEYVQLQEADRLSVKVSEREVDDAFAELAKSNKMSTDEMKKFLSDNNVTLETMKKKMQAELSWSYLVRGRFSNQINISEDAVEKIFSRNLQNVNKPRFFVSEILLPIDRGNSEAEVKKFAEDMIKRLRGGTDFGAIARQFSASPSAANGGRIGWVSKGELSQKLDEALGKMEIGQVSEPIRIFSGFAILALNDSQSAAQIDPKRNIFDLYSIIFPNPDEKASKRELSTISKRINSFRKEVRSCENLGEISKSFGAKKSQRISEIIASQLPPSIYDTVQAAQIGEFTTPRDTNEGIEMIFICNRTNDTGITQTREQIEEGLYSQRLNLIAQRYLRDLKRNAVIELR